MRNRNIGLIAIIVIAVTTGVFMLVGVRPPQPSHAAASALPGHGRDVRTVNPAAKPIRLALSAAFVSEKGIDVYGDISRYLGEKLGVPCEIITGLSYETINSALESGKVDAGFICGLPYVLLHDRDQPAVELAVAPVMKASRYDDKPKYFSDLIVRADSPYKSLEDLRGTRYVYNEETSNSGYNMPRYRLLTAGFTDGFFGTVARSGSHEESIRMVAEGEADASYVDSLVLDYDREKFPADAGRVRVIESLGPAGTCPVVVSTRVSPEVRAKIVEVLSNMHTDPKGRAILDAALVDRFVRADDANWNDVRKMNDAAQKAGYTSIR